MTIEVTWRSIGVAAVGLAHFAYPAAFEPLNRWLGFTSHTRRHVLINGAIETSIGFLAANTKTRRLSTVIGAGYTLYLAGRLGRSRLVARTASAR